MLAQPSPDLRAKLVQSQGAVSQRPRQPCSLLLLHHRFVVFGFFFVGDSDGGGYFVGVVEVEEFDAMGGVAGGADGLVSTRMGSPALWDGCCVSVVEERQSEQAPAEIVRPTACAPWFFWP